jgi:hypothetical protein
MEKHMNFGKSRAVLIAAILVASAAASAGTAAEGTLAAPHFMSSGVIIVYTSGSRTGVPACATPQPQRFAFDATTAAGKSQLAGMLTAFTAGKSVIMAGTGTCSVIGDSETLSHFYISD